MKFSISVYFKDFNYIDYFFDNEIDLIEFITNSLFDNNITSFGVVKLEDYKKR